MRAKSTTPITIDEAGLATPARQVASPNHDARPPGTAITLVVVHGISLPPGQFGGNAIERLFTNRLDPKAHPYYAAIVDRRVSAHFLIRRGGALVQFVACGERAWHAGVSAWEGRERCNDYSIGIELEGADDIAYAPRQYTVLAQLIDALRYRYPISAVAGHSDIAPSRKTDPGPSFDWQRLHALVAQPALATRLPGRV